MSRLSIPFAADDISALARSLRGQLTTTDHLPGHVELLNMLARSAGYQNYQHFRAQAAARGRLEVAAPAADPVDHLQVERAARHFDMQGCLIRWPAKASHQRLCLWGIWACIPAGEIFTERQINEILKSRHLFGDHALLRRALYDEDMLFRTADGRVYRRIERRPPAEAVALVQHLSSRKTDIQPRRGQAGKPPERSLAPVAGNG
jgi:hypothetical protein